MIMVNSIRSDQRNGGMVPTAVEYLTCCLGADGTEHLQSKESGRNSRKEGGREIEREFEFEFELIFILQRLQIRQGASLHLAVFSERQPKKDGERE